MPQPSEEAQWEALRRALNRHFKDPTPVRIKDRSRGKQRAFQDPTADQAVAQADKALVQRGKAKQ